MEENDKKLKVKLTTIIGVIVILAIIVGIVVIILNNNNNNGNEEKNVMQVGEGKIEHKQDYEDTEFSFKFLKMENKKENMVYSPLSIKYALKMLNDGANGNTKTQIENVIGNGSLVKYDNIENVLSLANALYIRDTYSQYIKSEYKNNLVNKYNAEIKYDAFKNAKNINSWIENKTFGQIKNMLKDEMVTNPDTQMFLINALAIDMSWKNRFDENDTHGREFYLDNGSSMQATTMNKETKSDSISYYKDNKVTALAMDLEQYNNEQMQFIAIMPNENLSNYVENFDKDDYEKVVNNLKLASETKYGLDISIPKFSFDYDLNLKTDLANLGITDAFNPELADFSNMSTITDERPLWVSDALHKANIDFSERGVKAAAVTVLAVMDTMAMIYENKPIEIKIDKPFMYFIKDKSTGEIWFVGTVYEPNSWENDKSDYYGNR